MASATCPSYLLVPVACGQVVAVEIRGGMTEADTIAEMQRCQKRMIVVVSAFAFVALLAASLYAVF